MPVAPYNRTILSQIVLPVVGWASFCLGMVSVVVAFFPPPPPSHPMIYYIRPSAPMITLLLVGVSFLIAGLSMVVGSKLAQSRSSADSLVGEKRPITESWKILDSYEDQTTAEALAELLRNGGVPAKVEVDSPIPGLVENVRVVVSDKLLHRAKWIINQEPVSQRELEYVATSELADSEDAKV